MELQCAILSIATGETTNLNPPTLKSPFLQKKRAWKPQQSIPWILRPSQHYLWNAKVRQEEWHNNSDGIGRCNIVPSQGRCRHPLQDLILPKRQWQHFGSSHLVVRQHWKHYIQAHHKHIVRCHLGNQGWHPPHCSQQDWHTLNLFGSSYSNVLWELPGFCHHDDWLVAGPAMHSCVTFRNKSMNSTTKSPKKMITHMFHRHIPNYTSPTISNLDPRQCNHPHNAKTRIKVGGDIAQQARLPAFAQFHWAPQSKF